MQLLSNQRILASALRFKYSGAHRATWWLRDESLTALCESVGGVARDIIGNSVGPEVQMLKSTERKAVFRVQDPGEEGARYVAKLFCLEHLSRRLRYWRYGLDEVANLLQAEARGINTPKVYGYGHTHDAFGLVRASIVILEDFHDLSLMSDLMSVMPESERVGLFMNTIPLFVSLYRANCNHIDLNGNAIMLDSQSSNPELFLLDFHHAKFHNKPSVNVLMFEAGYFARSCREWVPAQTIGKWAADILSHVGITEHAELQKAGEIFEYHLQGKGIAPTQTTLSRKQRQRIR